MLIQVSPTNNLWNNYLTHAIEIYHEGNGFEMLVGAIKFFLYASNPESNQVIFSMLLYCTLVGDSSLIKKILKADHLNIRKGMVDVIKRVQKTILARSFA